MVYGSPADTIDHLVLVTFGALALAFMGYGLSLKQPSGADVTRKLVAFGLPVVSISSSDAVVEAGGQNLGAAITIS